MGSNVSLRSGAGLRAATTASPHALVGVSSGATGQGVTVGILSDSFDVLGGAAADEASGALPPPSDVDVVQDSVAGTDEGRAMAQVVHAVAPDAKIAFYASGASEADFATGIAALKAAGATVIVDDLGFGREPFFQLGDPIEKAIRSFVLGGGTYVSAAGNSGPRSALEAGFQGARTTLSGIGDVTAMNFGTASDPRYTETVSLSAGTRTSFDLQWDQPWLLNGGAGSAYSLALAIYDPNGNLVRTISRDVVGRSPVQVGGIATRMSGDYSVAVYVNGGEAQGGTFKLIANNDTDQPAEFADASGGSIFGHAMSPYALTVGAAYRAGAATVVEPFTSNGPDTLFYSAAGGALATPHALEKGRLMAEDGQSTTVPGITSFYGTSAAAPVVAATAALLLQIDPNLRSSDIRSILQASITPVNDPAYGAGAGVVDPRAAIAVLEGALATPGTVRSASADAGAVSDHLAAFPEAVETLQPHAASDALATPHPMLWRA